jgi:hypothetical protein
MSAALAVAENIDEQLQEACVRFADDPAGFDAYMYDWGQGQLKDWEPSDWWQKEIDDAITEYLTGPETLPLCIAISSGHGAAKTSYLARRMHWFMSCRAHPQVVCTANTETQLMTKTWRELAKWHKMAHNGHWFDWTATSYYLNAHPETWKANAIPWSENNTEAFAGTHEENVLVVYDEASKISDRIFEVTDGIFTTKKNIWLVAGNGTRNVGRFYDCFGKLKGKPWKTWQIDSRTCKAANKEYLERLVEQYGGEDTDQARVRVRGLFPKTATRQLISTEAVEKCQGTEAEGFEMQPLVMGVDIARFGENSSTICFRQGRRIEPIDVLPKQDLMQTAHYIAERIRERRPIESGVELPKDQRLKEELTCVEYDYTDKGRIRLDRKSDIMEQYGFSPDRADALAMTYAYPVADFSEMGAQLDPPAYAD